MALLMVFAIRFLDVNSEALAKVEHAVARGARDQHSGGDVTFETYARLRNCPRPLSDDPHYKARRLVSGGNARARGGDVQADGRTMPSAYFVTRSAVCNHDSCHSLVAPSAWRLVGDQPIAAWSGPRLVRSAERSLPAQSARASSFLWWDLGCKLDDTAAVDLRGGAVPSR